MKSIFFRSLIIFPIIIILTFIWLLFTTKSLYNKHIDNVSKDRLFFSMIVFSLLFAFALGVQIPNTLQQTVVYSGLVGLIIYGITNVTMLATSNKWNYSIALIDTLWGVLSTILLGYILYIVVQKWPNTFQTI